MAEPANRVNRQLDDTQDAFTDIKDLNPEEHRMEAAPSAIYDHQLTSSSKPPPQMPAPAGNPPVAGHGYSEGHTYGINPAGDGAPDDESLGETSNADHDSDDKKILPTLTFNEEADGVQGGKSLAKHQEATDRIVDNWTPQYKAAKREHEELVERISATRELWPEYRQEHSNLIQKQNNPMLRDIMEASLMDDIRTFTNWHLKASEVEHRSIEALSKIEDMNTFSVFYKNQADYKAITQYDELDMPSRRDRCAKA